MGGHLGKPLGLGRRYPGQMEPVFADTGNVEQFLG